MLQPIKVQIKPREVSQKLLSTIENKRVRDVLEERFGLKNGEKKTLEAIGKKYNITRERVRQIEADGLRQLATPAVYGLADSVFRALEDHLKEHGSVAAETKLLESISNEKDHTHVQFLLTVGKQFQKKPETEVSHPAWYTTKEAHDAAEKILLNVYRELEAKKNPVAKSVLFDMIADTAAKVIGHTPKEHILKNYLGLAKNIGENPYGEYGLVSWATIQPKGVRDKAYLVLSKAGKPLHFREVTEAINKMGWPKKAAHPQTVHNELIKAQNRFVLVGRGLYALRDWGYTPGTVAEVMQAILKDAGKALPREEIISRVLSKRFVKENTIVLNLQNRSMFAKQPDGKYFLV